MRYGGGRVCQGCRVEQKLLPVLPKYIFLTALTNVIVSSPPMRRPALFPVPFTHVLGRHWVDFPRSTLLNYWSTELHRVLRTILKEYAAWPLATIYHKPEYATWLQQAAKQQIFDRDELRT